MWQGNDLGPARSIALVFVNTKAFRKLTFRGQILDENGI